MRNLISTGLRKLRGPRSRYAHGDRHATIISVATVKGGVGKTTTAVNLACGLAARHRTQVLLVDLDAQGHCTSCLTASMDGRRALRPTSEILLSDESLELLDSRVRSGVGNLDITPADTGLSEAEGRISQKIGKELLLRDALRVTRSHYDYIVIDCPPNKGNLTLNALMASQWVLVPTDLSPLAVQGADELLATAGMINDRLGHDLQLLGVLLTRFDARNSSVNEQMLEQVREAWQDLVFETRIGVNTHLAKSQMAGQSIFDHAPNSRGAKHYRALTDEVLARLTAGN
jgi:chromosome partitioning protein